MIKGREILRMRQKMKEEKAITLIALVITIIILIILASISIGAIFGENGLIQNAIKAAFIEEIQAVKENVDLKKMEILTLGSEGESKELFTKKFNVNEYDVTDTLKREILYIRNGMPDDKSPNDYDVEEFESLVNEEGNVENVYIIDKETANGKEDTFIYDETTDTVYKIPPTKIGKSVYHSYECLTKGKGGTSEGNDTIDKESDVIHVGEEYYYAPNLKGFNATKTSVVYYSGDFSQTKEVSAQEYIDAGEQYQIEGGSYTFHNYGQKIWANVKTVGFEQETWWVWVPRYAYKANGTTNSEKPMDIIYVGTDNKPLNPRDEESFATGEYTVHPAFSVNGKELKGIWISKYEASYQLPQTDELAPDLTGFDKENTYIELYNGDGQEFTHVKLAEANLNTINQNKKWYDYENKIWANIKTVGSGQETWWVWIPRYAYNVMSTGVIDIIYIDENDRPISKEYNGKLPSNYIVHPAFNANGKKSKGIWMSKYEASYVDPTISEDKVEEPNLEGFDKENTYIELYNGDGQEFTHVKLAEADLKTINQDKKWYDYANKKWANIKTVGGGQETWWVWIPRYAYILSGGQNKGYSEIIFIDENDKPLDPRYGTELPSEYTVHPAFNVDGKKLKGIWMSKYEANDKK